MCKACTKDWRAGFPGGRSLVEMQRVCREARRPGPPAALRPVERPTFASLPGAKRPHWMEDGPLKRSGTQVTYPRGNVGFELPAGRWWLDRQLRRLKGGTE